MSAAFEVLVHQNSNNRCPEIMILKSQRPSVALIWLCGLFAFSSAVADELVEEDAEALAKKAQNPISTMISLPLQNNTDFDFGPEEGTLNTLNVQPVWPFDINDNWNLVARTILPLVCQPCLTTEVRYFRYPNGARSFG